jgi:hypothetical protein
MQVGSISDALPSATPLAQQGLTDSQAAAKKVSSAAENSFETESAKFKKDEEEHEELQPRIAALREGVMTPPKFEQFQPPQQTDPLRGWGSPAVWLAALSGLFVRQHATASLNAMAGVLNAFKQRDADASKMAFEQWKVANENASKAAEFTINAYKAVLDENKDDEASIRADGLAVAAALKDDVAAHVLETQGIEAFTRYVDALDRNKIAMDNFSLKLDQYGTVKQAELVTVKAHEALLAAQKTGDPNKISDAQAAFDDAMFNRQILNPKAGGGTSKVRSLPALVAQKFQEDHPDATVEETEAFAEQYQARAKAARDFATGTQGNAVRSFNVAISHLNTLDDLVGALGNGDVTQINRASQAYAVQTGQAAPTNFDAAKAIVGDEIIKAIVGSGGALADRENAQNQINKAESVQQLRGVIETYKKLMAGQLAGLKKQYQDTTGFDDFDKRLSAETMSELGAHDAARGPRQDPTLKEDEPKWKAAVLQGKAAWEKSPHGQQDRKYWQDYWKLAGFPDADFDKLWPAK